MRATVPVSLALALSVLGCGTTTHAARHVAAPAQAGVRYQLYTHCGIEWARIRGTFWRATPPLSDGSGNPPQGWGNPYQRGRLTFRSATAAEFRSAAGSVTFKRTGRRQPPFICS